MRCATCRRHALRNMTALVARYGYIGPAEHAADWPANAWIDSPLELLDWVGLGAARS